MRSVAALLSMGFALAASAAQASPESEVASAFDRGDKLDLHLSLHYQFSTHRAAIKREVAGLAGADPDGPIPVARDLYAVRTRHELVPRVEIGVFTDLALTAALPIILGDLTRLDFDQRADDCVFPGDARPPTCIDAANSTTVRDGLVPPGGVDADAGGGTGGATLFRGIKRSGLDQLHTGIVWAAMNQARDSTKPTWKIGAELRFSIGRVMELDRTGPGGQTGASRGVHELRLSTSMARRIGWMEPFFEVHWQGPVGTRAGAPLDRPEPGFGAQDDGPQTTAGGRFGLEATAWQNRARDEGIGVHLSGHLDASFEGRGYSDMWEVFAYAGDAEAGGPLALDADPTASGTQAVSHPGVSNIDNYLTLGGAGGLYAHLGQRIKLGLAVSIDWEQSHLISSADEGIDGSDANGTVDPGTEEVNPLHVPLIDAAGRRYLVDEALIFAFNGELRLLF